jgi:2-polyprenyl-3-methyl-5-hydroxy-6-metoxy-1,4-benzoquinol methylase
MPTDSRLVDERVEVNRAMWDERVPIHVASAFYDLDGWKTGAENRLVAPFEEAEIGPVDGRRLCHLQCHIGKDTLTFARRGATVVGVDFSAPAVEAARRLATEIGVDDRATFVQSTVEEARAHVDGDFDVVYTSWGALIWLPDLGPWARSIASLLRPGGFVYVADQHPMTSATYHRTYFPDGPLFDDTPGTYADLSAPTRVNEAYEWMHPMAEIVTSLADAGLRIDFLHEHRYLVWQDRPDMVQGDDGMWRLPGDPYPQSFSLRASAA